MWLVAVVPPTTFSVDAAITSTSSVYGRHGVRVEVCGLITETPGLPSDIRVGLCGSNDAMSLSQQQLNAFRPGARAEDVVIYFVRSTVAAFNGCAKHPERTPSAVVVQDATIWTVAHELGHVLGLEHQEDTRRLMVRGTGRISVPDPILGRDEIEQICRSPWVTPS
jgi:hypothetical protein